MSIHTKVSDTWKDVDTPYVKVSGTWKEAEMWTKVSGVWKQLNSLFTPMIATGGTITTDGDYKIHTFLLAQTGTPFTVTQLGTIGTVEYLVVAGGGCGYNSGGGAGGFRTATGFAVTETGYTITVGVGGTPSATDSIANGGLSSFSTISTVGGGGGAANFNGRLGGSGGGAGDPPTYTYGLGTSGQGNRGGTSFLLSEQTGFGGGGGKGAVGGNAASGTSGGNGGVGQSSVITGSTVWYGGGGGGADAAMPGGNGGTGGGGPATDSRPSCNGQANTGGGGGGGYYVISGFGGSGIVIIRYKYQ